MPTTPTMIDIRDLHLSHRGMPVLKGASLAVGGGEVVLLTGRTGAGKTSLIRALYGDLKPVSGKLMMNGIDLTGKGRRQLQRLRRSLGVIFQDDRLLEDRSVYENLRFALSISLRDRKEINRLALQGLADIGLSHIRSKLPSQLSGGEAQRVGVVRALAKNPAIILADEPTGDLDPQTTKEIFSFLASRRSSNVAMVIATHERSRALEEFPDARLVHIVDGRLEEISPHERGVFTE